MMTAARITAGLACAILLVTGRPVLLTAKGVKTTYTQYKVITYQNQDILCEPYTVKRGDWLYKIFRQKGEISDNDFSLFLAIFKKINPQIHNIDAIQPGHQILIPLKKVPDASYQPDPSGRLEVPVVEYSAIPENFDLSPFIQNKTIRSGDTVSDLLDKAFLKKGGGITPQGLKAFGHLNPDIKNIDLIYAGTRVVIPEPTILSQPWFQAFLDQGTAFVAPTPAPTPAPQKILPVIHEYQVQQLKRYASLIKGTLIHQGKMHFPGKPGEADLALDLTKTPVIERPPDKILLIPRKEAGDIFEKDLIRRIRAYWKHLKIEQIEAAIQKGREQSPSPALEVQTRWQSRKIVADLLAFTGHDYTPEDAIEVYVGKIPVSAVFGRVKGDPDLLINFGQTYGLALDNLREKGFDILSVPPDITRADLVKQVLDRLGFSCWDNPSFSHQGQIRSLEGIYAVHKTQRLFISWYPVPPDARTFLENEQIHHLRLP